MTARSPNELDQLIGQRIRTARLWKDMSLEYLALHLGISYQQVQKYERGGSRIPASRLVQFARALDCPVLWFLGLDEELTAAPTPHQDLADQIAALSPEQRQQVEGVVASFANPSQLPCLSERPGRRQ